jgi:hypothetical protein
VRGGAGVLDGEGDLAGHRRRLVALTNISPSVAFTSALPPAVLAGAAATLTFGACAVCRMPAAITWNALHLLGPASST